MNINNIPKLPNNILPNLRSKSSIAKRAATALNENVRTQITHKDKDQLKEDLYDLDLYPYQAMTDDGKTVTFSRGFSSTYYYFDYNAPSEKVPNKNIKQSFMKPGYYHGEKVQNPYLNMHYKDNKNSDSGGMETVRLRMVSNEDNSVSIVSKTFDSVFMELYNSQIPLPALKTENGETKTTFIPLDKSLLSHEMPLEPLFDSQIDVDNIDVDESFESQMYVLANTIKDNSSEKAQEFKKQFNMIDFFQNNKDEVFNKPIELATVAHTELEDIETTGEHKEIIDINDKGERLEVQKQGDVFNIDFYNKDNQLSMQGTFKILKDKNGVPLKENNDGKIFKPGEEGYANEDNKLCFDMKLETYHQNLRIKSFDFERNINLSDAKHRQNIKMSRYDRNGAFVREEEASTPLHSKKCLLKRMCKVYHNVYKSDLKEAKANFEHDMLNPDDLDPNLKSGD